MSESCEDKLTRHLCPVDPSIGRVAPLSFRFLGWSTTGPRGVLFGAIPLIRGNESEPCVPPVLFKLADTLPRKAPRMNLSYTPYRSSAV
jgi:hypothetical protein